MLLKDEVRDVAACGGELVPSPKMPLVALRADAYQRTPRESCVLIASSSANSHTPDHDGSRSRACEWQWALRLAKKAKAKSDGKYKGRAPTARAKTDLVLEMVRAGKTREAVAEELNISARSVFRILRDNGVSKKAPVERAA